MKFNEWLNSKLTYAQRLYGVSESLRYNGFYVNLIIKDTSLNFNSFKQYYDNHLKGKLIKYPFGELNFNKRDGSIVPQVVTKIKLGGVKLSSILQWPIIDPQRQGIQITVWFPEVLYK